MDNSLRPLIVDAGARYGLHPTWQDLSQLCDFHLFDIDEAECARLKNKYENQSNITIHNIGLSHSIGEKKYNEYSHKALNSLYEVEDDSLAEIGHMTEGFKLCSRHTIKLDTLDNIFKGKNVSFLKLDVEGSELDILKGSSEQFRKNILGVRSEVSFRSVFKGAPLFSDINQFLEAEGFQLLNLDYNGKGVPVSPYTLNDGYGYLVSTDGVWIPSSEKIFEENNLDILPKNLVFLAIFLFQNRAADVAFHFLIQGLDKGVNLTLYRDDPLFLFFEKKCLLLFKDLSYLPQFSKSQLDDLFFRLFGYKMPKLHEFYERIDQIRLLA